MARHRSDRHLQQTAVRALFTLAKDELALQACRAGGGRFDVKGPEIIRNQNEIIYIIIIYCKYFALMCIRTYSNLV